MIPSLSGFLILPLYTLSFSTFKEAYVLLLFFFFPTHIAFLKNCLKCLFYFLAFYFQNYIYDYLKQENKVFVLSISTSHTY